MALQATPYKVDLNLTDLDRSVYENLRFTVAKHPSETEERLAVRLIAYALWYHEQLAFGRGLSDDPHVVRALTPLLWVARTSSRLLLLAGWLRSKGSHRQGCCSPGSRLLLPW